MKQEMMKNKANAYVSYGNLSKMTKDETKKIVGNETVENIYELTWQKNHENLVKPINKEFEKKKIYYFTEDPGYHLFADPEHQATQHKNIAVTPVFIDDTKIFFRGLRVVNIKLGVGEPLVKDITSSMTILYKDNNGLWTWKETGTTNPNKNWLVQGSNIEKFPFIGSGVGIDNEFHDFTSIFEINKVSFSDFSPDIQDYFKEFKTGQDLLNEIKGYYKTKILSRMIYSTGSSGIFK